MMLEIEAILIDEIAKAVVAEYPNAYVVGEYLPTPPSFPCVFVIELDNATRSQDLSGKTTHRALLYEIEVFSNLTNGRKSQCRAIASIVDGIMQRYGFSCQELRPTPNSLDASVYRLTGIYKRNIAAGDSRF